MRNITKTKYINFLQTRKALLHQELNAVDKLLKEAGASLEPEPVIIARNINWEKVITSLMKANPDGLSKLEIVKFLKDKLKVPGLTLNRLKNEVSSQLMHNKKFRKEKKKGKYKYLLNKK